MSRRVDPALRWVGGFPLDSSNASVAAAYLGVVALPVDYGEQLVGAMPVASTELPGLQPPVQRRKPRSTTNPFRNRK